MQEMPSISSPVLQKKRPISPLVVMNILTSMCLGLLLPFMVMSILSASYYGPSLSMAWENVSNGLKSGILYLDGEGAGIFALLFFLPLGIWSFIALVLSLAASRRKNPSAKKSTVVWAGSLFGVTLCIIVMCLLAAGSLTCIDEYHCALPIRPGVVVPTPAPYTPGH